MSAEVLLRETLACAVPLWIEELRNEPWDYLLERARQCAQIVAEKGDIILYRSKKKGETAKAFNALAEGLAVLAFAPGGVNFLGLHWEGKHGDFTDERGSEDGARDGTADQQSS